METKRIVFVVLFVAMIISVAAAVKKSNKEIKKGDKMSKVQNLTKEVFINEIFDYEKNKEWNFKGDVPVIIDFYADWCGPCKMIAPVIEELADEYDGKVKFYKVDTEKEMELSGAFGIRSIPSLLFIPVEGEPQMAQGALPKNTMQKAIDEVLLVKEEAK